MPKGIRLTAAQTNTVIANICKLRGLDSVKDVFSGKPKWSDEELKKYGYEKFGKFADNYQVLIAKGKTHSECFIVIDIGDTFEKYTILCSSTLLHLFSDKINVQSDRPIVSICFTSQIAPKQLAELNTKIFDFPYRFIILPDLYFCCGSRTKIGGLTSEYEILNFEETYNKKNYPVIFSNDPMIIALNGMPGELFKYSQIMYDNGIYKTVYIKQILRIPKNPKLPVDSLREDFVFGFD